MMRIMRKLKRAVESLEYFVTHEWTWENDNVIALQSRLNEVDRNLFNFDMKKVNWQDYVEHYVKGTRKFVLKEDDSTIPAAKRHLKK